MSQFLKMSFAAAFAAMLFCGAVQAADDGNDSLFMPYRDGASPDGRDQSVTSGVVNSNDNYGAGIPRAQALEFAMPENDTGRVSVWDQPSMNSGGSVSDRSLAMPYREGVSPDGRDQSVLGR